MPEKNSVLQAYRNKKRFVAEMFSGFLEAQRMVERLFLVPRLVSPAWHLCLRVSLFRIRIGHLSGP